MVKDLINKINKDIEKLEKVPREELNESLQDIKIQMSKLGREVDDLKLPVARNSPNFEELITACEDFIEEIINDGYVDYDYKGFIYANAIEAVYGKGILQWIRKHNNKLD